MPPRDEHRYAVEQEFNKRIGANIKALREHHDYTQEAIARHANMDVTKLSRVEAGERPLSFREGAMVAQYFGISILALIRTDFTRPNAVN